MKNHVFYLVVATGALLLLNVTESAYFSDVHWSTAIKLSEYESYRSVSLLSYNIPEQSAEVMFSFQAKTSGKECSFKKVHIYMQHGSYPLVTLYNESFPAQSYINRTDAFHAEIVKDAEAVSYYMSTPRPGTWYMAAFLPKPQIDQINQKGFKKSCMYGMFVVVNSQGVDNVEELSLQEKRSIHLRQKVGEHQAFFRYVIPQDVVEYTVIVKDCVVTPIISDSEIILDNDTQTDNTTDNSTETNSTIFSVNSTQTTKTPPQVVTANPVSTSKCPIILRVKSEELPSAASKSQVSCGNLTSCRLDILSPVLDKWSYILLQIDNDYNVSDVSFKLEFEVKACHSFRMMIPRTIYLAMKGNRNQSRNSSLAISQNSCVKMDSLGRFVWNRETFNISYFWSRPGPIPIPEPLEAMSIPDYQVLVTNILVQDITDIGGTLKISADFVKSSIDISSHNVVVFVCLMKNRIPGGETIQSCEDSIQMKLNSTSGKYDDVLFVPYPEPGNWFLALTSQCFHPESRNAIRCKGLPLINMDISISGCMEGVCGEYGECRDYISGVHVFSSCFCYAGWRGYGCTDGTEGRTKNEELLSVLLLTLSNLFFLPAICLAIYRHYFVEAAIYTYTMFFSSFYHACDTSDLLYYCMLNYDILSFADFLGSISSFWVTMLAMSQIPKPFRSFAQTLGAIGVSVGVEYDRHGLWVFAIPAGIAAIVMFASWMFQCKKRKSLFPGKMYFLCHFLPGLLLAATGLVLFAFFETDANYKYTHSAWHIAMSLSIVFLLPSRHKKELKHISEDDASVVLNNADDLPSEIVSSGIVQ